MASTIYVYIFTGACGPHRFASLGLAQEAATACSPGFSLRTLIALQATTYSINLIKQQVLFSDIEYVAQ